MMHGIMITQKYLYEFNASSSCVPARAYHVTLHYGASPYLTIIAEINKQEETINIPSNQV